MALKGELSVHAPAASRSPGVPGLKHFASEYLLALPVGVLVALIWSSVDPISYYGMALSASFAVNDIAMVFFFALITKEVVEATVPGGVLHSWKRVALPVLAAFVASTVTVGLFAVFTRVFDEPMLERGWAATLAVDIALGYFVARFIFGRSGAVAFFLVLALAANALGFLGLAVSEPVRIVRPWVILAFGGAGVLVAFVLRQWRVHNPWPYLLGAGGLSWTGCYLGGLHPALAMLPIVPFLRHGARDPGFFVDAPPRAGDPLSRLERVCRHPAQAALFLFGLVNAGVAVGTLEAGVWSLPLAALIGRPAGLMLGVAAGTAAGLHLPEGVRSRQLIVLGLISAVGFTMTLFFASAVIGPGQLLSELRTGALITVAAAAVAIGLARVLRVGRYGDTHPHKARHH